MLDEIADRQGADYAANFITGHTGDRDDLIGDLMAAESALKADRQARADARLAAWEVEKDVDRDAAAASPFVSAVPRSDPTELGSLFVRNIVRDPDGTCRPRTPDDDAPR